MRDKQRENNYIATSLLEKVVCVIYVLEETWVLLPQVLKSFLIKIIYLP